MIIYKWLTLYWATLYISFCAFAINDDGADKLSSALTFQNYWICHWLEEM